MVKRFKLLLFLVLILPSCVEDPVTYPNTWQGNFDALWNTIDQRYCYLDYKQINWDSIHVVYQNRLSTVSNETTFFDLIQDYPSNFQAEILYSPRYLGSNYRIAGGMRYGKIDGGNIGYIYYGDFTSTFSNSNLKYIFNELSDCQGLILDVRDNGGGYLTAAETLASSFFSARTLTGYMAHKTGNGHSAFSKPIALYTEKSDSLHWSKPVVVLTNRLAFSATNAFVSRMKYAPNATIVGDRTGGGGGLPLSNELPNGWLVRFSACPMFDAAMQHIEWGVEPNVKVDMRSADALAGYDTIIERAIALLRGL